MTTTTSKSSNSNSRTKKEEQKGDAVNLRQYATFIDETLYPELKKRVDARNQIEQEIEEYRDLSVKLQTMQLTSTEQPSFRALVDLGHESVFCQALAIDRTKVFVHVGMRFHVEMTISEAMDFCQLRIEFLQGVLTQRVERATQVAHHLETSLGLLEQLTQDIADA